MIQFRIKGQTKVDLKKVKMGIQPLVEISQGIRINFILKMASPTSMYLTSMSKVMDEGSLVLLDKISVLQNLRYLLEE